MAWAMVVMAAIAAASAIEKSRSDARKARGERSETKKEKEAAAEEERKRLANLSPEERAAAKGILEPLTLETPQWIRDIKASTMEGVDPMEWTDSEAALVGDSEFENIEGDPRLREAQTASLGALQELVDGGGMNSQDKANLARIQSQTSQADRGRREAILQNASQRGMGGSGMELLAQLDSSQAATDRQAQEGLDVAGMAQDRALQAMMQGGSLAGSIRGQDHSEAAQRAAAMDAISKFNAGTTTQNNQFNTTGGYNAQKDTAGNTLHVQQQNASNTQAADIINAQGRQAVENEGVDIRNTAAKANTIQIPQQNFNNVTGRTDNQTAINTAEQAAADQRKRDRDALTAKEKEANTLLAAKAAEAAAKYYNKDDDTKSDERAKKDIKEVNKLDMETFLATIQPKSFKYKDDKDGQGEFTGVMAQDLLKSKVGSEAVVQADDEHLGYNKDKMQGVILAALKHLNTKIDKKG